MVGGVSRVNCQVTWRVPPGCPGYVIHPETREVWSLRREVPAKGGSTRTINSQLLKPSKKGQVCLSIDGVRRKWSVTTLWKRAFPELVRAQWIEKRRTIRRCRNGHPLTVDPEHPDEIPQVGYWGSYNRVCLLCVLDDLPDFNKGTYGFYGTAGSE